MLVRLGVDTGFDLLRLSLVSGEVAPFVEESGNDVAPVFSPDGGFIAYTSNEGERREVYVRAFPRGDRKLLVSTGGGTHPLWPRAGNELFYWNGVRMTSVAIETPDLRLGTPVEIFQDTWDRSSEEALSRAYDYDAVGQRFLMARLAGEPVARQINVVLNWAEELTERVPVD